MHLPNESTKSESQNAPDTPSGNSLDSCEQAEPAQTMAAEGQTAENVASADNDLYNLWSNFYKAQNEHVIQMVTEIAF